jgi:benzodiazapine receptor
MRAMKFFAALLLSFSTAAIGSIATFSNIPTWYASLAKPAFTPPSWLFGPVWTILYILIGISFYLVWTAKIKHKNSIFIVFFIQFILNALWSIVFFGLHSLWGGLVVILLLLVSIVTLMAFCRKSKPAIGYLLIPYLLWVGFATCLNLSIAFMN